eukprot:5426556-Prymnesium_polylepis.1
MISCLTVRFTSAPKPSHTPLPCPGGPNSHNARMLMATAPAVAATGHAAQRDSSIERKNMVLDDLKWLPALHYVE